MNRDYILKDTKQIKRMKKHSLSHIYHCNGEIYHLLSLKTCHKLVKKIKKGKVKLHSKILYGRSYITLEENFVSLLNKYIEYVRNNYLIITDELVIILEQTLKNIQHSFLYSNNDFHDYPEMFLTEFKKTFLSNLIFNTKYYAKKDTLKNYPFLQKVDLFLKNKQINSEKDLNEIEEFFINIINNRKSNLCYAFIPYNEVKEKQLDFYMCQLNWIYEDYFKRKKTDSTI